MNKFGIHTYDSPLSDERIGKKSSASDVITEKTFENISIEAKPKMYTKSSQKRIRTKSKGVNAVVKTRDVGVTCDVIPSPANKFNQLKLSERNECEQTFNSTIDSIDSNILSSSTSYNPSCSATSTDSPKSKLKIKMNKGMVYEKYTVHLIEGNPSLFVGIDEENMYVIKLLHESCGISIRNIYLT